MDELALTFLPYPHVYKGERKTGALRDWPARCFKCDLQCELPSAAGVLHLCSYGVNYVRVDEDLLIAGIIVRDFSSQTKNRKKMLRVAGKDAVPLSDVEAVLYTCKKAEGQLLADLGQAKAEAMREYLDSGEYRTDIVELLRPSLEQTFAQVHDYRQLITQIVQNVNVILETTYSGVDLDAKLDAAPTELRSIYWAARLMEYKLESALYLAYPERITDPTKKVVFRLHGAIRKYVSIYRPLADRRNVKIRTTGESFGNLMENPDALGVIPHAFLDNAIKYAPDDSEVLVHFSEDDESIALEVSSLGPQIAPSERTHIFDLFYRGDATRDLKIEGTGFGLGLAAHVASTIGAELQVRQGGGRVSGSYPTTFAAKFRKPLPDEWPSPIVNARERRRGGRSEL